MEEPKLQTHLPDHYIDILTETYEPAKTKAGREYIRNPLSYYTFEQDFMSTDKEWSLVSKHGFELIGFLCALRMHMTMGLGYGIKLGRDLRKALMEISVDSNVPVEKLQEWYDLLMENEFLIIIDSSDGTQVVTTYNQVFNWELREYTKWVNRTKAQKSRTNKKNKDQRAPNEDLPLCNDEIQAIAEAEAEAYYQEGGM